MLSREREREDGLSEKPAEMKTDGDPGIRSLGEPLRGLRGRVNRGLDECYESAPRTVSAIRLVRRGTLLVEIVRRGAAILKGTSYLRGGMS